MRLSIRLSKETLYVINELKNKLEQENTYFGLKITNGFVVNIAFQKVKHFDNVFWKELANSNIIEESCNKSLLEVKTNLIVNQDFVEGIKKLKELIPQHFDNILYITNSQAIFIIIKVALSLKQENK